MENPPTKAEIGEIQQYVLAVYTFTAQLLAKKQTEMVTAPLVWKALNSRAFILACFPDEPNNAERSAVEDFFIPLLGTLNVQGPGAGSQLPIPLIPEECKNFFSKCEDVWKHGKSALETALRPE